MAHLKAGFTINANAIRNSSGKNHRPWTELTVPVLVSVPDSPYIPNWPPTIGNPRTPHIPIIMGLDENFEDLKK